MKVSFVGSGGIFACRDRDDTKKNSHRELAMPLRKLDGPPPSRFGDQPKVMYQLKQAVKGIIGREGEDLYDLARWTVWSS
jgi:hypothetical protein